MITNKNFKKDIIKALIENIKAGKPISDLYLLNISSLNSNKEVDEWKKIIPADLICYFDIIVEMVKEAVEKRNSEDRVFNQTSTKEYLERMDEMDRSYAGFNNVLGNGENESEGNA